MHFDFTWLRTTHATLNPASKSYHPLAFLLRNTRCKELNLCHAARLLSNSASCNPMQWRTENSWSPTVFNQLRCHQCEVDQTVTLIKALSILLWMTRKNSKPLRLLVVELWGNTEPFAAVFGPPYLIRNELRNERGSDLHLRATAVRMV